MVTKDPTAATEVRLNTWMGRLNATARLDANAGRFDRDFGAWMDELVPNWDSVLGALGTTPQPSEFRVSPSLYRTTIAWATFWIPSIRAHCYSGIPLKISLSLEAEIIPYRIVA